MSLRIPTYKEMKRSQKEDIRSKKIVNTIYRNVSTILAFIFLKFGVSPNTVTIFSFFVCIAGFIFLSRGSYLSIIIGSFFFILFKIFDDVDGELARAANKKSFEGLYFECVQDYIFCCCFGIGLGIGLFNLYKSTFYLYMGFFLTLMFVLSYSITTLLKFVIRKGILEKGLAKKVSEKMVYLEILHKIEGNFSWEKKGVMSRLFGLYPPGLMYSFEFVGPILIIISLIEYVIVAYGNSLWVIFGQHFGIITIYFLIFGFTKLIRTLVFISMLEKNRYITNALK